MKSSKANISEIFSSLQGEGLCVGERMTFVRFAGCSFGCSFCDTPQGLKTRERCRVETPPRSERFSEFTNPVTADELTKILESFDDSWISVTGGEPLEQADFLAWWLPTISRKRKVLLETNGVLHSALCKVLPYVHVISMDIKLPSATGRPAAWKEHAAFLSAAIEKGRGLFVKVVVTRDTVDADIDTAVSLLSETAPKVPVVIQPATQSVSANESLSEERLRAIEHAFSVRLPDVRIIPQMHKQWGVL